MVTLTPSGTINSPRRDSTQRVGPGTELKRLLAKFRLFSQGGCNCDQKALMMDIEGPDWCEENLEVIVGWLEEAAQQRGIIARLTAKMKFAPRILVRRAIKNARRKLKMLEQNLEPLEE
jgi:hypothetical protein